MNVSTGHLLVLDCGVLHDVEALEENALLTISWRREKKDASESLSFSSTQRHLIYRKNKNPFQEEGRRAFVDGLPEVLVLVKIESGT